MFFFLPSLLTSLDQLNIWATIVYGFHMIDMKERVREAGDCTEASLWVRR